MSDREPAVPVAAAKHPRVDRCFYCMTEDELHSLRGSAPTDLVIHMDSPLAQCPNVDPRDWETP